MGSSAMFFSSSLDLSFLQLFFSQWLDTTLKGYILRCGCGNHKGVNANLVACVQVALQPILLQDEWRGNEPSNLSNYLHGWHIRHASLHELPVLRQFLTRLKEIPAIRPQESFLGSDESWRQSVGTQNHPAEVAALTCASRASEFRDIGTALEGFGHIF